MTSGAFPFVPGQESVTWALYVRILRLNDITVVSIVNVKFAGPLYSSVHRTAGAIKLITCLSGHVSNTLIEIACCCDQRLSVYFIKNALVGGTDKTKPDHSSRSPSVFPVTKSN